MIGSIVAVLFALAEYQLAVALGLSPLVGATAAVNVGILAVMLMWFGGLGQGVGSRW